MASMGGVDQSTSSLQIRAHTERSVAVLTVHGGLNTDNFTTLATRVQKAMVQQPTAVIVDITAMHVADASVWPILLGLRWQLDTPATVALALVCTNPAGRQALAHPDLFRFMPMYGSTPEAIKALATPGPRRAQRAQAKLPSSLSSLRQSRRLTRDWLTAWARTELIPVALVIVNVLVENVLEHTGSDPVMRIECDDTTAVIAVADDSKAAALRLPSPGQGVDVSGLAIVDALARTWSSTPTPTGKTVWAVIGPESQL